jgi:hypothetical protein
MIGHDLQSTAILDFETRDNGRLSQVTKPPAFHRSLPDLGGSYEPTRKCS